jgi:hypothetical protein
MGIDMENANEAMKRLVEAQLYQTAVEMGLAVPVSVLEDRERDRIKSRIESANGSARKFTFALDFTAESAKTFIAAWGDGKWVPTGNRSSRRKMGVGGKRW